MNRGVVKGSKRGPYKRRFKNSAIRSRYTIYINSAKVRGIEFNITYEQFKDIITQDCHYCSIGPTMYVERYGHSAYVNGIDRIDNTKGYIIGNIVPSCPNCNYAKRDMTYQNFIKYLKRVAKLWG